MSNSNLSDAQFQVLARLCKQEQATVVSPLNVSPYLTKQNKLTVAALLSRGLVQVTDDTIARIALTTAGRTRMLGDDLATEREGKLADAIATRIASDNRNFQIPCEEHSLNCLLLQVRGR